MSFELRDSVKRCALERRINYDDIVAHNHELQTETTCCRCSTSTSISLGEKYILKCKNNACLHAHCEDCVFKSRTMIDVGSTFVPLEQEDHATSYGTFCCHCGNLNAVKAAYWQHRKLWHINFLKQQCQECKTAYCQECRRVMRASLPGKKSKRRKIEAFRSRLQKIRAGEAPASPLRRIHTLPVEQPAKSLKRKADCLGLSAGGGTERASKRRRVEGPALDDDNGAPTKPAPTTNKKRKVDWGGDEEPPSKRRRLGHGVGKETGAVFQQTLGAVCDLLSFWK
ncbi:hypothetical protein K490DRAFT_59814 [Saccharata proteae CBS 121410]|uniref:Uncharacterized protein n=1 Tax=Saccharata proteae CBS 121410 TaxID=1314787 RepID=A0A9P4HMA0_9PEZI|nr:hypothetical protein K490DRAFT_59814 [Saccharata proteae CBS 121410]